MLAVLCDGPCHANMYVSNFVIGVSLVLRYDCHF